MEELAGRLVELHSGDERQLEAILSSEHGIIVQAPAGYGKTKTMVSRIARLIASNRVPNPKRVLALTFGVSAAYNIRRELTESLPWLLAGATVSTARVAQKVYATNYHGFSRRLLRLYGHLLSEHLPRIDMLTAIDDSRESHLARAGLVLCQSDLDELIGFNVAVRRADAEYVRSHLTSYASVVKSVVLPNGCIPYNAILVLGFELLGQYPEVAQFYREYFTAIVVDEVQDTNLLSWWLLRRLIGDDTELLLVGDPLQRIYGFIGAIADLMSIARCEYNLYPVSLETNHRFEGNTAMLTLDACIRANARDPRAPHVEDLAVVPLMATANQDEESIAVVHLAESLLVDQPDKSIAVLVRQRGNNTNRILEELAAHNVPFFYALFSDEDSTYVNFHALAADKLRENLSSSRMMLNAVTARSFVASVREACADRDDPSYPSLVSLLSALLKVLFRDYRLLPMQDKVDFLLDTFDSRGLKQFLGHVDSRIVVSTVHGAKGLEWDYVILPDMEQFSFPTWLGLCGDCPSRLVCELDWDCIPRGSEFEGRFYEELSVFYVAATRARVGTYFSYSRTGIDSRGLVRRRKPSCLLRLPGMSARSLPLSQV